MGKYASVAKYLASLTEDRRRVMETLRQAATAAAPEATEAIAYNMPALRLNGKFLVSYEAYKNHYSLFPWTQRMVEEMGDELKPYQHGKGALRFPAQDPIPTDLVQRVVRLRVNELREDA
jgi:uncharacterized protein YdhG (YjbR/CyaY superfamily)